MSHKAGYLKESKQVSKTADSIGTALQKIGQTGYTVFGSGVVEQGMQTGGQILGSALIPIPIVGGMIGKKIGENASHALQYGSGLLGEIGGAIKGEKNIGDVLSYLPKQIVTDWWNSPKMQVLTGRQHINDALINTLEDYSMVGLFSNKEHAWKDSQGNYHKQYVPGSKMVVGEWVKGPSNAPRPDLSSNSGILGVRNGEIYYKGFDDARWKALQKK